MLNMIKRLQTVLNVCLSLVDDNQDCFTRLKNIYFDTHLLKI